MPNLSPIEIILILAVILLLFGAKRLPDAARGLGRSLRIFKSEVKAAQDDDGETAAERDRGKPRRSRRAPRHPPAHSTSETRHHSGALGQPALPRTTTAWSKTARARGTKKTSGNDGAAMPLMAHLRELRARIFKALLAIAIGAVVAWFFYDPHHRLQSSNPFRDVADRTVSRGLDPWASQR